jgi:hypothetical protein
MADARGRLLQLVLEEYDFSGWVAALGDSRSTEDGDMLRIYNKQDGRTVEIMVPPVWLDEPRRHGSVAELVHATIDFTSADPENEFRQRPAVRETISVRGSPQISGNGNRGWR